MEHVVASPIVEGLTAQERRRAIRRLRALTRLLDTAVPIPGTPWRVGLDPILGLIPGAGDVATTALSLYMVHEARRLGADKTLLRRMMINVGLDFGVGLVPLLGDVFDFAFKANLRNWKLLLDSGLVDDQP